MPPSTTVLDRSRRRVSAMSFAPPRASGARCRTSAPRLAADSLESDRTTRTGAPCPCTCLRRRLAAFGPGCAFAPAAGQGSALHNASSVPAQAWSGGVA
ncbi:hypothetical protein GCM10010398_41830 [Streptomyces fimbriatus]